MKQKQVQAFMQNPGNFTPACHCKNYVASDLIIHERKRILTRKAPPQNSMVFILGSHLYPNAAAAAAVDSEGCWCPVPPADRTG